MLLKGWWMDGTHMYVAMVTSFSASNLHDYMETASTQDFVGPIQATHVSKGTNASFLMKSMLFEEEVQVQFSDSIHLQVLEEKMGCGNTSYGMRYKTEVKQQYGYFLPEMKFVRTSIIKVSL